MNKKKIMWIVLLIVFIIAIVAVVISMDSNKNVKLENTGNTTIENEFKKSSKNKSKENVNGEIKYQKKELDDGVLYSIDGKEYKSDIIIGDNYFDTTITDMYLNPENYMNKNIEIEGMYLENLPYTFVGRYSTSSLCPYCPTGYSYLEYQLKGSIDRTFKDESDWIKVIGTLAKGNDETSNYEDFYYLEVLSLEVMNEKGELTVTN